MIFDFFDSPELLDIQRTGFYNFLNQGIPQLLAKEFPIKVKNGSYTLELCLNEDAIKLIAPEDDPRDCILKMKSYNCKLYAQVKLVCKRSSSSQDFSLKEKDEIVYQSLPEWVLLGQLPMMTKRGHFIINGSPRVIVHQVVRSPGIYFQKLVKKDDQEKARFYGDIIPLKGVWVRLQMSKKGRVEAKFKKGKKVEVELLQKCLQVLENQTVFSPLAKKHRFARCFFGVPASRSRNRRFAGERKLPSLEHALGKKAMLHSFYRKDRDPRFLLYDDYSKLLDKKKNRAESKAEHDAFVQTYDKLYRTTQDKELEEWQKKKRNQNFFKRSFSFTPALAKAVQNEVVQIEDDVREKEAIFNSYKPNGKREEAVFSLQDQGPKGEINTSKALGGKAFTKNGFVTPSKSRFFKAPYGSSCKGQLCKPPDFGSSSLQDSAFKRKLCSENLFATFKLESRYDLGLLGREKINKKFGLLGNSFSKASLEACFCKAKTKKYQKKLPAFLNQNVFVNGNQNTQLTALDLCSATLWLYKLRKGDETIDDIDHSQNRRVKSTGDLLHAQFENGVYRLKNLVSTKLQEWRPEGAGGYIGRSPNTKGDLSSSVFSAMFNGSYKTRYNYKKSCFMVCGASPAYKHKAVLCKNMQSKNNGLKRLRPSRFARRRSNLLTNLGVWASPNRADPLFLQSGALHLPVGAGGYIGRSPCKAKLCITKKSPSKIFDFKGQRFVVVRKALHHQEKPSSIARFSNDSKVEKTRLFRHLEKRSRYKTTSSMRGRLQSQLHSGAGGAKEGTHPRKQGSQSRLVFALQEPSLLREPCNLRKDGFVRLAEPSPFREAKTRRLFAFAPLKAVFLKGFQVQSSALQEDLTGLQSAALLGETRLSKTRFFKGLQISDVRRGKGEAELCITELGSQSRALQEPSSSVSLMRNSSGLEALSQKALAKELFSTKPITGALREFFGSNPLSQYMDQTNPLAEITHKRRISSLGVGGVSRESAGMAIRGIHPTHYGRICPIETPEGKNAGLVNSLAFYTKVDKNGFLKTPYYRVFKGQVQPSLGFSFCSAQDELLTGLQIAPSDLQKSRNNILRTTSSTPESVPVRVADNLLDVFKKENPYKVELIAISPIQMISVATSLIPFLEHNDANRALMGSNMQRQAVPLMISERPVVGTGLESTVIVESGHITESQTSGFASHVTADKVVVDTLLAVKKEGPYKAESLYKPRLSMVLKSPRGFLGDGNKARLCKPYGSRICKPLKAPARSRYKAGLCKPKALLEAKKILLGRVAPLGFKSAFGEEDFNALANKSEICKPSPEAIKSTPFKIEDFTGAGGSATKICSQSFASRSFDCLRRSKARLCVANKSAFASKKTRLVGAFKGEKSCKAITKKPRKVCPFSLRAMKQVALIPALVNDSTACLPSFASAELKSSAPTAKLKSLSLATKGRLCKPYKRRLGKAYGSTYKSLPFKINDRRGVSWCLGIKIFDFKAQCSRSNLRFETPLRASAKLRFARRADRLHWALKSKILMPLQSKALHRQDLFAKLCITKKEQHRFLHAAGSSFIGRFAKKERSVQRPSSLISTVSPLTLFSRSNQNTCITEKPLVQEFDWVQRGDILSDCSASKNGELAVGKNVLLAYIPWEGYNFEDAIVISERLVKEHVYTSLHIERYVFRAEDLKDGAEWFTKDLPGVEPRSIHHLESSGLAKIGSFLKEGDIIVGKIRYLNKKPSSPYERLLCDILGERNFAARNKSLYVPKGVEARVVYHKIVSRFDNDPEKGLRPMGAAKTVHLFLGERRVIQVGDKISGRHGNKGVISTILPRQDMPYLPDGTPIDIVLNPLGVPSRMNVGQVLECLLGLAASYLDQHFKTTSFDERYGVEASKSIVFLKLYQARLQSGQNWLFSLAFPGKTRLVDGRSGECFDQWITVGKAYILKLIHMVSEKIHARSTGPYALITQQPLRGRSNRGGQRLGEMEVWALQGFGAAYTLQELLTKKSDDSFGRKQVVDSILPKPSSVVDRLEPGSRLEGGKAILGHPEIFKVLLCELQALCLDLGVCTVTPDSFQRTFLGSVH